MSEFRKRLPEIVEMIEDNSLSDYCGQGSKNFSLFYDNSEKVSGKDGTKFYISVLEFLEGENMLTQSDLNGCLSKNPEGQGAKRISVKGEEVIINTNIDNSDKIKKVANILKKIHGSEIALWEIKWESSGANESKEDRKTAMNQDNKVIDEMIKEAIINNKQVVFTGAPGTGKTFCVKNCVDELCGGNKDRYEFVQFHPSYDYSDFVEGLRPVVIKGQDSMSFVRLDGIFKAFCRKIVKSGEVDKEYYFVVDEINRADLSKVFGELMFGLEEGYRGKDHSFRTQYNKLPTYMIDPTSEKAEIILKDDFKDGFYIPVNLTFIGTMNDIDRSVDSMDFALRRRFKWIEINANTIMVNSLKSILKRENNWDNIAPDLEELIEGVAKRIINMNENLIKESRFGLTEAYYIGPAYFKKLKLIEGSFDSSLSEIFDTNIVSIIKEYTRGRQKEEVKSLITLCRDALNLPKIND